MKNVTSLFHLVKNNPQVVADTIGDDLITEPIRESFILFIFKITAILVITDLAYAVLNVFLLRTFFLNYELPLNLHNQTAYILTLLHLIKTVFQVWTISAIVCRWVGNVFYIKENQLVHHEGILNCREKIYDLDIVRSVSVHQSWFGKVFKFGNVLIEVSASGGYTDQVILNGVNNPQKYESIFRKHF